MSSNALLPSLIFMTLFAGLGFALVQFLLSLQRRSNRVAAADGLLGDDRSHKGMVPDGALPELLSLVGIAVVVMALLGFGYLWSGHADAPVASMPAGGVVTPASPNSQMSNPSKPTAAPAAKPDLPTSATTPPSGG